MVAKFWCDVSDGPAGDEHSDRSQSKLKKMKGKLTMAPNPKNMSLLSTHSTAPPHLPASLTATKILDHLLNLVPALHAKYARHDEVDAALYAHFESTIPIAPPIQPHESNLVDTSLLFDANEQLHKFKRMKGTITSPVDYFQKIEGDAGVWGKAVATIDTSHTHVFSYLWNQHSHENTARNVAQEGPDALRKVVFVPDSRSMLNAFIVTFGLGVSSRIFTTWFVWSQQPDKSFIIAFAPMTDFNRTNSSTAEVNNALSSDATAAVAIHSTVNGFWRIKPLAPEGKRAVERAQEERAWPTCKNDHFKRPA